MKTIKLLALFTIIALSSCTSIEDKLCNKEWVFSSAELYDKNDKMISSTEDQTKPVDDRLTGSQPSLYFTKEGVLIVTDEYSKHELKYRVSDDLIIVTFENKDDNLYITNLSKNIFEFKHKNPSTNQYIIKKYKLLSKK